MFVSSSGIRMRLMMAVATALVFACGCGEGDENSRTLTAATIASGIHDASVMRSGESVASIANVLRNADRVSILVYLDPFANLDFGGTVTDDGMVTAAGSLFTGDVGVSGTGTATFRRGDRGQIVSGSFTVGASPDTTTFTLTRSDDADATTFSGTYRIRLTTAQGAIVRPRSSWC